MRRQYHSQVVDGHTLIWDAHRLIEQACGLPVRQVPLSAIRELDQPYWFGTEPATCRAIAQHALLIRETDLAHPIILSESGRVMDGMHRVCKAFMEGRLTIGAVQFLIDPSPDHVDADIEALPYDEPGQMLSR